ncbi:MAG: hypothetical protein ACOC3I_04040 [Verrucomicrobiota bacterium]
MKPFIGTCVSKGGSHDASGDATDRPGLRHLRFIGSDLVNGNGSPCQEEEFTLFGSASRFTDDTLLTVGRPVPSSQKRPMITSTANSATSIPMAATGEILSQWIVVDARDS